MIPVCLWFLAKDKSSRGLQSAGNPKNGLKSGTTLRDRRGEPLFIDARKLGTLIDRVHRELTYADLDKIISTYHKWRGDSLSINHQLSTINYPDLPGFCKSATTAELASQFAESDKLEAAIRANLKGLGYAL